jgi:hypothetical protein
MKTTVGKVRKIIREVASSETDMQEYGEFKVGEHYFVPRRPGHYSFPGGTRKCTRIYSSDSGPKYGVQVFVTMRSPGSSSTMLANAWLELGARPGTPEEIKNQVGADSAAEEYMRKRIDTSKEGT